MQTKSHRDDEDMSMEEILASIRKYVTDDHVPPKPDSSKTPSASQASNTQRMVETPPEHSQLDLLKASVSDTYQGLSPDTHLFSHTEEQAKKQIKATDNARDDDILDLVDSIDRQYGHTSNGSEHPINIGGTDRDRPSKSSVTAEDMTNTHTAPSQQMSCEDFYHILTEEPAHKTQSSSNEKSLSKNSENWNGVDSTNHTSVDRETPKKDTSSSQYSDWTPQSTDHFISEPYYDPTPTSNFTVNSMTQLHTISTSDDGLASRETLASSSSALSKLVQAVKPQPASESTLSAAPTLDTLIAGLARPMVKEWIDQNLTKIVEKMVAQEIEKITKNLIK